jgi:regulatory protein
MMMKKNQDPQPFLNDPEPVFNRYYNLSLRYISYRPRSEKEVYAYLVGKQKRVRNLSDQIIAQIMQRLTEYKFVDDREFAKFWIEHRKKGFRILKLELQQKGISKDIIEEASSGFDLENKEINLLQKLIEKKQRSLKNETPQKAREKMIAHLMRKGFGFDLVKKTLDGNKK